MTEHTAADFAAARFAEHPDGRIAARLNLALTWPWEDSRGSCLSDAGMSEQGWRIVTPAPDPSDPDVIEQAADRARLGSLDEEELLWRDLSEQTKEFWRRIVRAVLTPPPARDPKVDELKQAIEVHWDNDDPGEIARYLIAQGWTRVGGGEDA